MRHHFMSGRFFFSMLFSGVLFACVPSAGAYGQDFIVRGKSVRDWTKLLESSNVQIRQAALVALAEAGPEAASSMIPVARLLRDPVPALRPTAAQALFFIGKDAAPVSPALARCLGSKDPNLRLAAAKALERIGSDAILPLVKMTEGKDSYDRLYGVMALDALALNDRITLQAFEQAFDDSSVTIRRVALAGLIRRGVQDPIVTRVVKKALSDKDKIVRQTAVASLLTLGKEGMPLYREAASDPSDEVRLAVLRALTQLDEVDVETVVIFRKALSDGDAKVRQTALVGLARLGTQAREFGGGPAMFIEMARLLEDKHHEVRRAAALALGHVGIDDAGELETIARGLKDADSEVRKNTILALGQYCTPKAPPEVCRAVVMKLMLGLGDRDVVVQSTALETLASPKERVVEHLVALVKQGGERERVQALRVLGEIGPAAVEALPIIETLRREGSDAEKRAALVALSRIKAK